MLASAVRTAAAVVCLLACVCACAGVSLASSTVAHVPTFPLDGPRFEGDRVVWAQGTRDGRGFVVRDASRVLGRFPPTPPRLDDGFSARIPLLAAGPGGVGLHVYNFERSRDPLEDSSAQTFVSTRGSDLQPSSGVCRSGAIFRRNIDVSGEAVAFRGQACSQFSVRGADGSVAVLPAEAGGPPRALDPRSPSLLRIAGRFAAWTEREDVILYDLQLREVVRRETGVLTGLGEPAELDLRADGALVLSGGGQVVVIAPGATPRALPLVAFRTARVAIWAGESLLLFEAPSQADPNGGFDGTLTVRTTDGAPRWTVASGVRMLPFRPSFDVSGDGTRVTWVQRTCRGSRIRVSHFGEPTQKATPTGSCDVRLALSPTYNGRSVRLKLASPACVGFAPCRPFVEIRTRDSVLVARGLAAFDGSTHLRPTRRGHRELRRATGRAFVITVSRFDGDTASLARSVDVDRATRRVTIRSRLR